MLPHDLFLLFSVQVDALHSVPQLDTKLFYVFTFLPNGNDLTPFKELSTGNDHQNLSLECCIKYFDPEFADQIKINEFG